MLLTCSLLFQMPKKPVEVDASDDEESSAGSESDFDDDDDPDKIEVPGRPRFHCAI